ncbi:MAG TPA: hypothetical protein DCS63_10120 [Elusimicrobia bacterium]|nr:hypothetical protein [Elusimicrobiota bacterium]
MITRFFITLFFAFLCSGTASAAAPALNTRCFDGAGACADQEPAPVPEPADPAPMAATKPVVISIVGVEFTEIGLGKLELAYFQGIVDHFKPGKVLDEDMFASCIASVGAEAETSGVYSRFPDDYLDANLRAVLPAGKYELVPVRWSRDPDESDVAVPIVEKEIKRIFAAAKSEGRPVYLVAHSWGTVLAHTVLHRLAVASPEVRIEKLITLGSPLVPGHWWLNIFMKLQINAGHLQQHVTKPANVGYWVNLWAKNDFFSNEILAADKNGLQDDWTVKVEEQINLAADLDHSLRDDAIRDLFFLKNLKNWHFAYIYDFKLFSKTLRKDFKQSIFSPVITEELAAHPAR